MQATIWYTGQQAETLTEAAAEKGSLYLTTDPDFAASYGRVFTLTIHSDAKVFDTSDRGQVAAVVGRLLEDYEQGMLPYELRDWVERAIEWHGDAAAEMVAAELAPSEIRNESAYDSGDLQVWLWESFEYDLVVFRDEDTALLLNAVEMAVSV